MDEQQCRADFMAWVEKTYRPKFGDDWRIVAYNVNHGNVVYAAFKANWLPAAQPVDALVAAAPDLLSALQGVLRVADRATVEFDAARAAIAKATGK